jgi:hypothetical protein
MRHQRHVMVQGDVQIVSLDDSLGSFRRFIGVAGTSKQRRAIPTFRPNVSTSLRIDELCGGADALALALDRAFKHIPDLQVASDLPPAIAVLDAVNGAPSRFVVKRYSEAQRSLDARHSRLH